MDFTLDLDLGRALAPGAAVERELREADVALLANGARGARRGSMLKRLRDSHHAVAQALAAGLRPGEAAAATGYSTARIAQLREDPAFIELMAYYRTHAHEEFAEFASLMGALGRDVLEEIRHRLETEPEGLTNDQLERLLKLLADRTGHAPVARSVNTNIHIGLSEKLQAARERVVEVK